MTLETGSRQPKQLEARNATRVLYILIPLSAQINFSQHTFHPHMLLLPILNTKLISLQGLKKQIRSSKNVFLGDQLNGIGQFSMVHLMITTSTPVLQHSGWKSLFKAAQTSLHYCYWSSYWTNIDTTIKFFTSGTFWVPSESYWQNHIANFGNFSKVKMNDHWLWATLCQGQRSCPVPREYAESSKILFTGN